LLVLFSMLSFINKMNIFEFFKLDI